jgi:hypothetical protein
MLVAAVVLASAQSAIAQRSAASKITGSAYEAPYFYNSAGAYQDNAYAHVQVMHESARYGQPVPPQVVQEHVTALHKNLAEAGKHYDSLRSSLKDNKAAAGHLDEIDAHHKQAFKHAADLKNHVAKGHGDSAKIQQSTQALAELLQAAKAAHARLTEHVKPEAESK